jgi:hypothetical protein
MQVGMAKAAGIALSREVPQLVADARLQAAITRDLSLHRLPRFRGVRGYATSESQANRINELRRKSDGLKEIPLGAHEAEAWIQHLSLKRRLESITKLKLEAGDIVQLVGGPIFEVTSIREDGRVQFKGGRGSGAWPDELTIKCRRDEGSATAIQLRSAARNAAARRAVADGWSLAKSAELAQYLAIEPLTEDDVVQLESCINAAKDEKPIQELLTMKPHILGSLPGGTDRYCIPKQRLGIEHVTDFLLCHGDSLGANWTLVELETPRSSVTIKSSNQLEKHARTGLAQIADWRRWLESNLDPARRRKRDHGLGLIDIPPSPPGIVLVGRRDLLLENSEGVRKSIRANDRVEIHTYDWLLERLRNILHFSGPPAANPYLIQRPEDESAGISAPMPPEIDEVNRMLGLMEGSSSSRARPPDRSA